MSRLILATLLFVPLAAQAQSAPGAEAPTGEEVPTLTPNVVYAKTTEVDFVEINVSASVEKPSGALVAGTMRGAFGPMIELRSNFNTEMKSSIDDVR